MSKQWSEIAWNKARPLFSKIKNHAFIKNLMDGSLSEEQFAFYIAQDSIYLGEYGKVLAGIGAKLSNLQYRSLFLKFSCDTIFVEHELHKTYKTSLNSNEELKASPTCLLYTSFLHQQLAMQPIEVAIASVLPCFVIYKKVGDFILENQMAHNNPYQNWINTYGGDDFAEAVQQAEDIVNSLAKTVSVEIEQKMTDAYLTASSLEWMFWNSAYQLEKWPL